MGCFQIFHYPVKITASISQNDINCGRNLVVCKAILTRNGTSYVPSHGSCFHFSLDSGRPRAPCFRPHCESAILGGPDDRATTSVLAPPRPSTTPRIPRKCFRGCEGQRRVRKGSNSNWADPCFDVHKGRLRLRTPTCQDTTPADRKDDVIHVRRHRLIRPSSPLVLPGSARLAPALPRLSGARTDE